MAEKNEVEKKRQAAYAWAVQQVSKNVETNVAKVAREASLKFNLDVVADTLRKLLWNNRVTTTRSGQKGKFTEEELKALEVSILTYLALSQANCSAEKKRDNIITILQGIVRNLGEEKRLACTASFWQWMQGRLAAHLDLDAESVIELTRQFWTTYPNLMLWYDGWEEFVLSKGFAVENPDGSVHFHERMTHQICNLDETKFYLDGSNGGIGGCPCCTIRVKMKSRTGTASNKSGCSSTLICASNAAGEPMPMFIAFASEAESDEHYKVRADWLVRMPKV